VNTPANDKMSQPYYLALQKEEMPVIKPDMGEGRLQIVSGEYQGIHGKVKSVRPVIAIMGWLDTDAHHMFTVPEGHSTFIYLLDGTVSVKGFGMVDGQNLIDFETEGTKIHITAAADSRFLLLSAEPLNEPIAWQGPFVMNNETQILEAMRDYQMGKMGMLIEDFD
jgi:redox-sensitive bicupin YhaK (pirin superfamily)